MQLQVRECQGSLDAPKARKRHGRLISRTRRESMALPTPRFWTSSLQSLERINCCCFKPARCGPLLRQPWQMYTGATELTLQPRCSLQKGNQIVSPAHLLRLPVALASTTRHNRATDFSGIISSAAACLHLSVSAAAPTAVVLPSASSFVLCHKTHLLIQVTFPHS